MKKQQIKTKTTKKKHKNNKHENRNNPTYPAGAGRLWGWIWWSSLVSFFLLNACLRIWSIFGLKKKGHKTGTSMNTLVRAIMSFSWLFHLVVQNRHVLYRKFSSFTSNYPTNPDVLANFTLTTQVSVDSITVTAVAKTATATMKNLFLRKEIIEGCSAWALCENNVKQKKRKSEWKTEPLIHREVSN